MKALILTNEYPPHIYGGAGVHVDYLTRELAKLMPVDVRCFGEQAQNSGQLSATGYPSPALAESCPPNLRPVFSAAGRCLNFCADGIDAQLVHCHTWYTHLGGILAKLNYGIPLFITVHSLEPLRPWKREQLGRGFDFSLWVEKTALEMADAVISVSLETKADVKRLFNIAPEKHHVIHNGVDPDEYRPTPDDGTLAKLGIDPKRPYLLFVGRITRQKGIIHLLNAIPEIDPELQIVLCAGAPDTPEIAQEMREGFNRVSANRPYLVWIEKMLSRQQAIQLYSQAALFCCPSVYEPFGIINLEAMACETAIVASRVGGIPEVVVDGETGTLVDLPASGDTIDGEAFSRNLAEAINSLAADPARREAMAARGRQRVVNHFSWQSIALKTHALYQKVVSTHNSSHS